MDKISRYVIEQLAASGFAVLSAEIAFQLRRDIWASRLNAGGDWSSAAKLREYLGSLSRVQLLEVQFEGTPIWNIVATRSVDDLARRIAQLTGLTVIDIRPLAEEPAPAPAAPRAPTDSDPCPAHKCSARADWFRRHGLVDEKFQPPKRAQPMRVRS